MSDYLVSPGAYYPRGQGSAATSYDAQHPECDNGDGDEGNDEGG
jgi:hypothetical protein